MTLAADPQPSPPTGLLDGLVRRQAAAAPPAAAKPSPGLIGSLGLAGALAPLGLGGLLPGVESAVGGIPIVGAPVAGIVSGADNAVGVTALLSPKDDANATANATISASASAGASANVKRQQPSDGLVGTLGLDGALGALGLGGLLGTVEQTVDGLPLVGPLVGGLLGTVDGTVGLSALLSPAPVVNANHKRQDLEQAARGTVPLSTLLGVLYTLEGTGGSVAATAQNAASPVAKPATGAVASSPLGGLSLGQAEALGPLPAGFANALLAKKVDVSA